MKPVDKLDDLTGLFTRSVLEKLDSRFLTSKSSSSWSLMVIDIDRFKLVNDAFGHLQGDKVIKHFANVLTGICRKTDTPLRYGGDEFVIVMPATKLVKAVDHAEKILHTITKEVFPGKIKINLSIGVAESKPGDNLARVFEQADKALFKAKKEGGNKVSSQKSTSSENVPGEISFRSFIGRQPELSQLHEILDTTIAGKGSFVLVSGEAGIGKTRLINELEHYSNCKDCLYIRTECSEHGAGRPYEQLTRPILNRLLDFPKNDIDSLVGDIEKVLPQTEEMFPGLGLKISQSHSANEESTIKFKIYSEISSILRWISEKQPVVFAVDNLQWISDNDFDLLVYLARVNKNASILFLTAMIDEAEQDPEMWTKILVLSNLLRYTSINLKKLSQKYSKHLIMLALRDPKIPKDILQRLVKQSNGNPQFLKELLISLRNNGTIKQESGESWVYEITSDAPLPATISQIMSTLLDSLDPFSKDILSAGSLLSGASFSLEPLCIVLQKSKEDVRKALEEPKLQEVIHEKFSQSGKVEYRFIHDTMRSFLYQEFTVDVRKALQTRLGLYYENIYKGGNTAVIPLAAHHYGDGFNKTKAMQFAILAEKEAAKRGASQEALRWLEQYMSFTDTNEEDQNIAFFVRIELGRLYTLLGKYTKASDVLKTASDFAVDDKQTALLNYAEGRLHYYTGNYSLADKKYRKAIKSLASEKKKFLAGLNISFMMAISQSRDAGLTELHGVAKKIRKMEDKNDRKHLMGYYNMIAGTLTDEAVSEDKVVKRFLKAVKIFRNSGDRIGEAKALVNTAAALIRSHKYKKRISILNAALKILMETGDTNSIMCAYINMGMVYQDAMDNDLARDYFQRCLELVEATGTKRFGLWAYHYLGHMDINEGNFISAEIRLREAIDLADELGLIPRLIEARLSMVKLLLAKKDFEQADIHLTNLENEYSIRKQSSIVFTLLKRYRGTERLHNPSINRETALEEAEANLRSAVKSDGNNPTRQSVDLMLTLVQCLLIRRKFDEAGKLLTTSKKVFEKIIAIIESEHYQQRLLNSPTADELNRLTELLEKNSSVS